MDTNTSTQSIAAAATACRVAHDAYHGGSCSLVARGHHSYSCSENRLGKPHLDHLLGTIEGLQKEVLRMRVSHDDKGSNAEAQTSKPPQKIDVFIPNPSHLLFCGTTTTDVVQSWDSYSQIGNCQYGLSAISLNPKHMAVLSSYGTYVYYYTWDGQQWTPRGAIPSVTTYTKPTVIQTSPNGFELFFVYHADYTIWHRTGTAAGEWSAQASIGDQKCNTDSYPVAVSRDQNLVDLFFVGQDNNLYWKSWADVQWKPPRPSYVKLGESCAHPGAVARHRNRVDLFALNLEGELLYKSWNGRDWEPPDLSFKNLGGSFASRPTVVSQSPERLDLFIIGKDAKLHYKALSKSIWKPATGFIDLGGNFTTTAPPTVVWSRDGMEIFLVGGADTWKGVYHKRWDGVEDPSLKEFEPLLKWDCALQPAVIISDRLDPKK